MPLPQVPGADQLGASGQTPESRLLLRLTAFPPDGLGVWVFDLGSRAAPREGADMKARFVQSVEAAETVRLQRILQDGDEREAMEFLQEHCREPLRVYLKGG